jgi:hypothetical protein
VKRPLTPALRRRQRALSKALLLRARALRQAQREVDRRESAFAAMWAIVRRFDLKYAGRK